MTSREYSVGCLAIAGGGGRAGSEADQQPAEVHREDQQADANKIQETQGKEVCRNSCRDRVAKSIVSGLRVGSRRRLR